MGDEEKFAAIRIADWLHSAQEFQRLNSELLEALASKHLTLDQKATRFRILMEMIRTAESIYNNAPETPWGNELIDAAIDATIDGSFQGWHGLVAEEMMEDSDIVASVWSRLAELEYAVQEGGGIYLNSQGIGAFWANGEPKPEFLALLAEKEVDEVS